MSAKAAALSIIAIMAADAVSAENLEHCNSYHPDFSGDIETNILTTSFNETSGIFSILVHMDGLETAHPELARKTQISPMLGVHGEYSSITWNTESSVVVLSGEQDGVEREIRDNTWAHSSSEKNAPIIGVDVDRGYGRPFTEPSLSIYTSFNSEGRMMSGDKLHFDVKANAEYSIEEDSGLTVHTGTEIAVNLTRYFKDHEGFPAVPHVMCRSSDIIPYGGQRIRGFEINFE